MRSVLLLACACGTAPPAAPPAPPAKPRVAAAVEAPPVHVELDTSIATVWGYDPNRRESTTNHYAPPPQPTPTYDRVVEPGPVARARVPGRRAPCFAKRDVLVAGEIANDLEQYQLFVAEEEQHLIKPPTRYGTCRAHKGELRDARGKVIATFSCGVGIYVTGIIDDLGFEVGAAGKDVAAAHLEGEPICIADDAKHTRCAFGTANGEESNWYSFPVSLPTDADGLAEPVRGDAARKVFDDNKVARIYWRGSCH